MNNSCSICLSDNIDINNLCMINDCNHSFCISCLTNWLESGNFTLRDKSWENQKIESIDSLIDFFND